VTGEIDAAARRALLDHPDEDVRAWTVQLELEDRDVDPATAEKFAKLAESDPSPVVRLYLAAGIRRLPPARRIAVLDGLVRHAEDAEDPNLPLVAWYAAEALAEANLDAAIRLLKESRIPLLREFMARRISALGTDRPVVNVVSIGARADGTTDDSAAFQTAIDRLAPMASRSALGRPSLPDPEAPAVPSTIPSSKPGSACSSARGPVVQAAGQIAPPPGLRVGRDRDVLDLPGVDALLADSR
jgi:hypothetical protein